MVPSNLWTLVRGPPRGWASRPFARTAPDSPREARAHREQRAERDVRRDEDRGGGPAVVPAHEPRRLEPSLRRRARVRPGDARVERRERRQPDGGDEQPVEEPYERTEVDR